MIDGRKVVVCTPAGRRESLEILVPYILRDRDIIDQYQLWLNTQDEGDVAYIRQLATTYPDFVKVVEPDPSVAFDAERKQISIHQFFKDCVEAGTVYLRLDDDIVFVDEGAIESLLRFRIENPQYFLVYGNTVNNAICSHLHQRAGVIDLQRGTAGYWCIDQVGWQDPGFAEYAHRWFIHHYQDGKHRKFNCFDRWELNSFERVSINAISWLGEEFAQFDGQVGIDEEHWLSQEKPEAMGKMNCIYGQALFCHYAFFSQKSHLDATNILDLYRQVCELETKEMPDSEKLFHALSVILSAPIEKLQDVDFLEHMIRLAGLFPGGRVSVETDREHQNHEMGAWQDPRELAEFMIYLQGFKVSRYLDIGAFYGWTCSLLTAVLVRFNPALRVTAIDPRNWWSLYPQIARMLPITYLNQTSDSYMGQKFDLVFIDGNHEYSAVKRDYENVGRFARLCALHDCDDDYIRVCPFQAGGVPKLWGEIKIGSDPCKEFVRAEGYSGIGLVNRLS